MPRTSGARAKDIWRHPQALLPALAAVALASVALAPAARAAVATAAAAAASWRQVPVTQAAFMNSPSASSLQTGDIACLSKSSCVAAGAVFSYSGSSEAARPVLWHWNGKTWSYSAPADLGSAAFSSSACAGPDDCFAVGATNPFRGITEDPLAVRFNGTRWGRPGRWSVLGGSS
ncbi:MAG: hypothetical protein ACYCST_01390 [Acidimicrobiales bacterium]